MNLSNILTRENILNFNNCNRKIQKNILKIMIKHVKSYKYSEKKNSVRDIQTGTVTITK